MRCYELLTEVDYKPLDAQLRHTNQVCVERGMMVSVAEHASNFHFVLLVSEPVHSPVGLALMSSHVHVCAFQEMSQMEKRFANSEDRMHVIQGEYERVRVPPPPSTPRSLACTQQSLLFHSDALVFLRKKDRVTTRSTTPSSHHTEASRIIPVVTCAGACVDSATDRRGGTHETRDCDGRTTVRTRVRLFGIWQEGGGGKAETGGESVEGRVFLP